jgi:WD40 repeat protein
VRNKETFPILLNEPYGHTSQVFKVLFTPDGKNIVSNSTDGTVRVWDVESKELVKIFYGLSGSRGLAISTNGKWIAAGSGFSVTIIDLERQTFEHKFKHHRDVISAEFTKDSRYLITGSKDKTIRLWNLEKSEHEHLFVDRKDEYISKYEDLYSKSQQKIHGMSHSSEIHDICLSPDNKFVVSGGFHKLKLWSMSTFELVGELEKSSSFMSLKYSPDKSTIYCGLNSDSVLVLSSPELRIIHDLKEHKGTILDLSISSDGKYLATASYDKTARIWDLSNYESIYEFKEFDREVRSVDISPDNKFLVTGSSDSSVKLWDIEGRTLIHDFSGDLDKPTNYSIEYVRGLESSYDTNLYQIGNDIEGYIEDYGKEKFEKVLKNTISGWVSVGDGFTRYEKLSEIDKKEYRDRVNKFFNKELFEF